MNVELITGKKSNLKPMLFNGIALVTDNSKNSLRIVVATAASTAYSFNPKMPVEEVWGNRISQFIFSIPVPSSNWKNNNFNRSHAGPQ
jgi:hypothetical protein